MVAAAAGDLHDNKVEQHADDDRHYIAAVATLAAFFEATTIGLLSGDVCRSLRPCDRVSRRRVLASRISRQMPRSRERSKRERKYEVLRKKVSMRGSKLQSLGACREKHPFSFSHLPHSRIQQHPHNGRPILANNVVGDTQKHPACHCRWSNPKNSTRVHACGYYKRNLTLHLYPLAIPVVYIYLLRIKSASYDERHAR